MVAEKTAKNFRGPFFCRILYIHRPRTVLMLSWRFGLRVGEGTTLNRNNSTNYTSLEAPITQISWKNIDEVIALYA